jgi:predicted nuclease of predicted toxin-antitoxin system
MRFIIDAQLSPSLAEWLRARGHDAQHVFDTLGAGASDSAIFREALSGSAILVSKDADFIDLLAGSDVQLLWIRIGNAANRTLFNILTAEWPRIEAELAQGRAVVELG